MKMINKTIKFYHYKAENVIFENGNRKIRDLPELVTTKKLTRPGIIRYFKKEINQGDIVIKSERVTEKKYSLSLDQFIKAAEKENIN